MTNITDQLPYELCDGVTAWWLRLMDEKFEGGEDGTN